ncbi:MAG: helix-turn-helix transcriptional regulator [Mogibacterium sp.]|nr:helix-turn-helix transcriptional regulator [Mogibacterium sp.]
MYDDNAYYKIIGGNISRFRKLQGIKQAELAKAVNRSIPCISKYENGEIAIDSYTLHRIAAALHISVTQLMPDDPEMIESGSEEQKLPPLLLRKPLYMYNYVGEQKNMIVNQLEINPVTLRVTLYAYAGKDLEKSGYIMEGGCHDSDSTILIYCANQFHKGDFAVIAINKNDFFLGSGTEVVGTLMSLSPSNRIRTMKCLITDRWITSREELLEALMFDREEQAFLKKNGSILI